MAMDLEEFKSARQVRAEEMTNGSTFQWTDMSLKAANDCPDANVHNKKELRTEINSINAAHALLITFFMQSFDLNDHFNSVKHLKGTIICPCKCSPDSESAAFNKDELC